MKYKSTLEHPEEKYLQEAHNIQPVAAFDLDRHVQTQWTHLLYRARHTRPADVMPILGWFPRFMRSSPLRKTLADVICGVTITAIVTPQGMAYGMLAGLPPVNGLYTAMLPALGYMAFGTCMHLSIGPFALISMLTQEGIRVVVPDPEANPEDAVEAARQIALLSGILLVLLGTFRLGFVGTFLSDPVLSGYQTAVSFIIPASQLKHAFQANIKRGNFISTMRQIVESIIEGDVNGYSCGIFVVSLILIYIFQMMNKKMKCLKKIPLPAELIVTTLATLVCFIFDLGETEDVTVSGKIPSGLPVMRLPKLGKFKFVDLLPNAAIVSLMTYITAMSAGKTFARKYGYEIDNNAELRSFGVANLLGCISSCYPAAASLSRTAVVGSSGAATPLHNLWTVVMLGMILLFCGPLIETLPNACLAAVVVMAFRSLLWNGYAEMKLTWRLSPSDFLMWSIAFWSTLITDVTWGILIAVLSDIFFLFYKTTRPSAVSLGRLPGAERIYRNRKHFKEAKPPEGVLIFRFDAPLHFANKEVFLNCLSREMRQHDFELNGCAPPKVKVMQFWSHLHEITQAFVSGFVLQKSDTEPLEAKRVHSVVVDCSAMTHIDLTAARMLDKLRGELKKRHTKLVLSQCKVPCWMLLDKMGLFVDHGEAEYIDGVSYDVICFRDTHDAVLYAEKKLHTMSDISSGQDTPGVDHATSSKGLSFMRRMGSGVYDTITNSTGLSSPFTRDLTHSPSASKRTPVGRGKLVNLQADEDLAMMSMEVAVGPADIVVPEMEEDVTEMEWRPRKRTQDAATETMPDPLFEDPAESAATAELCDKGQRCPMVISL